MRTKKGVVTAAKMKDTVTVTVHSYVTHPVYKKRFRKSKKFMADTGGQDIREGDLVVITECRPLSKNKHFKVSEIVDQAPRVSDLKEEAGLEKAMHGEKKADASLSPEVLKKESSPKDLTTEGPNDSKTQEKDENKPDTSSASA